MSFFELINDHFSMIQEVELVLRIVVASICGLAVGVERSKRLKDAGIRTHCMVACAAALLMIISKYGFTDMVDASGNFFPGTRGADSARIAAQIVTGMSFLGAGIIYRDRHFATRGLTTAAGIWTTAGIGMAIGSGLYYIGIFATVFVIALQMVTHRFTVGNDKYSNDEIEAVLQDNGDAPELLFKQMESWGILIQSSTVTKKEGLVHYHFIIKKIKEVSHLDIARFVTENEHVISFKILGEW